MLEKSVVVLFALVVAMGFVSAVGVSVTDVSSTLKEVSVSGASNLYAYEVNFSVDSGSVTSTAFNGFLGSSTSSGHNVRDSYLYVYETKLDSTQTGVDGSGSLFNITYSGGLTLRGLNAIDSSGSEEYVSYNVPDDDDDGGSGGSGGSSGGSGIAPDTPRTSSLNIIVSPSGFSINVIADEAESKEMTILNNGVLPKTITLATEGLADYITFDKETVEISPGREENVGFKVLASEQELIVGKILLLENSVIVKEVSVVINVRSEDFLFDAQVEIPQEFRNIGQGENIFVDINLLQVGPEEKVDVVANYIIKDFEGNIFLEESETFFVFGQKTLRKEIHTAALPEGTYVIGLEIVYPGAFAVSSAQFSVGQKGVFGIDIEKAIIAAGAVVVAVLVGMIVWAVRKKKPRKKR